MTVLITIVEIDIIMMLFFPGILDRFVSYFHPLSAHSKAKSIPQRLLCKFRGSAHDSIQLRARCLLTPLPKPIANTTTFANREREIGWCSLQQADCLDNVR